MSKYRSGTAFETVCEAVQALAVGSPRPDSKRGPTYSAVAVELPELRSLGQRDAFVYLAIPTIERRKIGKGALEMTRQYQTEAELVLGPAVVRFWLKKTQLQCADVARRAIENVKLREGHRCKLCAHLEGLRARSLVGGAFNQRSSVCHLVPRRDAFWRVVHRLLKEHPDDRRWLFTEEGTLSLREGVRNDPLHSNENYMVYLCKVHDDVVQYVMKKQQQASCRTGLTPGALASG